MGIPGAAAVFEAHKVHPPVDLAFRKTDRYRPLAMPFGIAGIFAAFAAQTAAQSGANVFAAAHTANVADADALAATQTTLKTLIRVDGYAIRIIALGQYFAARTALPTRAGVVRQRSHARIFRAGPTRYLGVERFALGHHFGRALTINPALGHRKSWRRHYDFRLRDRLQAGSRLRRALFVFFGFLRRFRRFDSA